MSGNNYRIDWADGTSTDIRFKVLPLVQLEIEDEFDATWDELLNPVVDADTSPSELSALSRRRARAFTRALWRWFQLRKGVEDDFETWFSRLDDFTPIGEMADAIAAQEGGEHVPEGGDSSPGSASQQTEAASPSST